MVRLTARSYRAVLLALPAGAHVLDVGVGTGSALVRNAALLRERNLKVTAIDVDPEYLRKCRENVEARGLGDRVFPRLESVFDHRGGPYGGVYFSSSYMLLPRPIEALRHVTTLLAPGGLILFTQVFEHRRSPLVELVKPRLKHLTTIEFGRVTYEDEFRRELRSAGLELVEVRALGKGKIRSTRLIIARPGDGLAVQPSWRKSTAAEVRQTAL